MVDVLVQGLDEFDGVVGQCAVEPVRIRLFVPEMVQQSSRPRQRCPLLRSGNGSVHRPKDTGGAGPRRRPLPCLEVKPVDATPPKAPLREVLLLCWRDSDHPQGGGSERYLERVGAELAGRGVKVTFRTAGYPGAPATESRAGMRCRGVVGV